MPVNESEEFCARVCRRTFLSLWSYVNPQGKDAATELCDILVVCDPDIVIISVKDCAFKDTGRPKDDRQRWLRRAVQSSAEQIYGAERYLRTCSAVTRSDGTPGLPLPAHDQMRVHRVAVAFGAEGEVVSVSGEYEYGKGFVLVLNERQFCVLLRELDTVTDFVNYLGARERFFLAGQAAPNCLEEDLLAAYLKANRRLTEADQLLVEPGLWDDLQDRPEWRNRKRADRVSYAWDSLIERFATDVVQGTLEFGPSLPDAETGLRVMAREDRLSRRILGDSFQGFLMRSRQHHLARVCSALSGVIYVFLATPRDWDRESRQAELFARCVVVKDQYPQVGVVLGVATEQYSPEGCSLDVLYFAPDEWTEEWQERAAWVRDEFGFFTDVEYTSRTYDEYPEGRD